MTDASDDIQDEEDAAPREQGLWAEVRYWLDAILGVFDDLKELAQVGITRSLAVKLCNWLWGVEGAVRRLILAEALKLDPASLDAARSSPAKQAAARGEPASRVPAKRRPSFRIFGFIGQGEGRGTPSAPSPSASTDYPERWHIRFPSDPLLSIGERPGCKRKSSALRRLNPLDRRGLKRSDPDYWLHRVQKEDPYAAFRSPGWSAGRPSRPKSEPLPLQERPGYLSANSNALDWRRVEEEWKQVIPAPHLAERILAVVGIMERREGAIRRIARYFQRWRERLADIFSQPAPKLAWPRRARWIYRSRDVETLPTRSHAELLCLDTS